jgi:aldose sugar dehydrogenase
MRSSKIITAILALAVFAALGWFFYRSIIDSLQTAPETAPRTRNTNTRDIQQIAHIPEFTDANDLETELVAQDLQIPWEIVWLPDNSMLVTQRPGTLLRIDQGSRTQTQIDGVVHIGEGGLMGMALHPDYDPDGQDNWLYLYLTTQQDEEYTNRVERYRFDGQVNQLSEREVIIDNIPGDVNHNGGRIAFGPDGLLYITTGDAANLELSQDRDSLAGKILRLEPDGSIPADNPFDSPIYSYGHRNPQGLAWDNQGRLWSTEHGPVGRDEVNLVEAGSNYGWPETIGSEEEEGMIRPVIHSGLDDTWAPSGMEIVNGTVLFTGLRGSALYSADIEDEGLENFRRFFYQEFGRLRVVRQHQDWLYIATNNTDGRGSPQAGDDRIFRIRVDSLL